MSSTILVPVLRPTRRHLRRFHRVEPSALGGSGRRSRQGGGPGGWLYPPRPGPAAQIAPGQVRGRPDDWMKAPAAVHWCPMVGRSGQRDSHNTARSGCTDGSSATNAQRTQTEGLEITVRGGRPERCRTPSGGRRATLPRHQPTRPKEASSTVKRSWGTVTWSAVRGCGGRCRRRASGRRHRG
jgi:hypothetical protein